MAGETLRVAAAVEALVVVLDRQRDVLQPVYPPDQSGALCRVLLDQRELVLTERARVRTNGMGEQQLAGGLSSAAITSCWTRAGPNSISAANGGLEAERL